MYFANTLYELSFNLGGTVMPPLSLMFYQGGDEAGMELGYHAGLEQPKDPEQRCYWLAIVAKYDALTKSLW